MRVVCTPSPAGVGAGSPAGTVPKNRAHTCRRGSWECQGPGRGRDAARRTLAWSTVIVMDALTASGRIPLVAASVNVARPPLVGVPDRIPMVVFRLSPAGRAPEDT